MEDNTAKIIRTPEKSTHRFAHVFSNMSLENDCDSPLDTETLDSCHIRRYSTPDSPDYETLSVIEYEDAKPSVQLEGLPNEVRGYEQTCMPMLKYDQGFTKDSCGNTFRLRTG